ncbi:ATPase F0F1 [Cereibacter changlensis JA139]|uniref:ATPase F0F1 n=2 Tax=Cereibacter changlensis TaxID=402884 RepID=A0A2T4JX37_9RHOB|nr:AtpZ/AtpI family protein [Cereibacter changlensis]PTE22489.1 ATPase F0F1 [Cereibacter changlensis JA139]PZX48769.1 ATP synthase protein I [Cereibacter changlensis]
MTEPTDKDPLLDAVRAHQARRAAWARDGEASVARRLAQIGVLGWIIVAPMLGGIFLGRWLDGRFDTGVFWTAPLLMIGLGLGGWFAWRWIGSA